MKRSARGVAPLHHAAGHAACHPNGTALLRVVALLALLLCLGCEANLVPLRRRLLDDDDDSRVNGTITADNVCLKSVVNERQIVYYSLDTSECLEDDSFGYNFLEVEARVFQQCADSHEWSVFMSTDGDYLAFEDVRENSSGGEDGTYVDYLDAEHFHYYGHLDIPLDRLSSQKPWILGFYSSCGPVQYTLKAWCSPTRGCDLNCSDPDSGPCVSLENCRCYRTDNQTHGCDIDVEDLPDEEDVVTRYGLSQVHNGDTLRYGTWKYFQFQAYNNASRILVELTRAYGDVVLFVKQEDSEDGGPAGEQLPTEQDAYKYADLSSFQNRLSHHHRFVYGSGNFFIGVYNTDWCLEEDTTFNITINIATPTEPMFLCPLNCSYPQGRCIKDNVCDCEDGYEGQYCSGSIYKAALRQKFSGSLDPGQWAYINMTIDELTHDGRVAVQFNSTTGHPILLAQQDRLPTLKDYNLKFTNSTLGATPSDTYHIDAASLGSGHLILGVFNVDYAHRGVSDFNIVILGEYGPLEPDLNCAQNPLSIWIILVISLGSSIFLLSLIATARYIMQKRGQVPTESWGLDFEAIPQDLEMVQRRGRNRVLASTFPLLAYQEGLLPREDAGCSICLSSYTVAELVCRLPGCKHVFHISCLEEWFQTDDSCPLCRVPLRDQVRDATPEAVSPDLRSPPPEEGTPSHIGSSSTNHDIEPGHSESPAPDYGKDHRPLLARGDSNSVGSSSNSERSNVSESPLTGHHSDEAAANAVCIVSPNFS